MNALRAAPTLGIAASLAVIAALAAPFALAETAADVWLYYGGGDVNPLVAGLFALVAVIVFAAGREGRTEPDMAAGVALVLGLFVVVLSALWALTVPWEFVTGFSATDLGENHRWLLVAVSLPVPASAAWYARALGVL